MKPLGLISRSINKYGKLKVAVSTLVLFAILLLISGTILANFVLNLGGSLQEERPNQFERFSSELGFEATYQGRQRILQRNANIDTEVQNFSNSFQNVREIAQQNNGYLVNYDVDRRGDWESGTVQIEVPSENFFDVRDDIVNNVGDVEDEGVRVEDQTEDSIDLESEKSFLEQREEWIQSDEADEFYVREEERREDLRSVREQIQEIEFDQKQLRENSLTSTIYVDMHEPEEQKPPREASNPYTIKDAFREGIQGGGQVLKFGITAIGYLIPVLVYGLIFATLVGITYNVWRYMRGTVYPKYKHTIHSNVQDEKDNE